MSKRLQELQAEHDGAIARVEAIQALVATENRDYSEDETKDIDASMARVSEAKAKIERESKIVALASQKLGPRVDAGTFGEPDLNPIKVPAKAIRGNLKSFTGPDAQRDAYISGQWLAATVFGNAKASEWCNSHGIQAAHSGTDNSKGGYTVPDAFESAVIRLVENYGVFRQNIGRVWPMPNGNLKVPKRNGGFTTYWLGENASITASAMAFAQVTLTAKKLGVLTQISSELLEDSAVQLADIMANEFAYSFANEEDDAGFNGDGTSTYGGIVGLKNALAAGSVNDAVSGNTAFGTLDLADFENCVGKLPQYSGIQPKWYIHQAGWAASMLRLANAAGGNTVDHIAGGVQKMFLGYPVVLAQTLLSATSAQVSTICAYFGDLSMACSMGDSRGMTVAADSSLYFASDAIALRATKRTDITVSDPGTASVCGAMVALKLAAS